MSDLNNEAKETNLEQTPASVSDFDAKADEFFANLDGEQTPGATSTPEQTTPEETETEPGSEGTDLAKKSDPGEKETQSGEEEIPQEFHKHPAWQRMLQERDQARQQLKQQEIEEQKRQEDILSSPEFIIAKMQREGYKDEAINQELRRLGHEVKLPEEKAPTTEQDIDSMLRELGHDPVNINDETKAIIKDIDAIAALRAKREIERILGDQLQPLKSEISTFKQKQSANSYINQMQAITQKEGILDFKTEIEPKLHEFIDKNPKANQSDVFEFFKQVNHDLSLQKLKTRGRKEERQALKENLRSNKESVVITPGKVPDRTGDFEKDADAFLDAMGVA